MDTTLELKNRIKKFVETADERILKIFNAIIDSESDSEDFVLSQEQKNILGQRLKFHEDNPSDGKTWDEVKDSLKAKYGL